MMVNHYSDWTKKKNGYEISGPDEGLSYLTDTSLEELIRVSKGMKSHSFSSVPFAPVQMDHLIDLSEHEIYVDTDMDIWIVETGNRKSAGAYQYLLTRELQNLLDDLEDDPMMTNF